MERDGEYIALSLPSHPRYLGILRNTVGEAADLFGFSEEEKHDLMLSVTEGCANIIRHCYRMDPDKKIEATIRIRPDRMEVVLRDYGEDPLDRAPTAEPCREITPGGLGVKLIEQFMDEVQYRPAENEGTLLTMVKYRSGKRS